jgi:Electron transfer DM13
MQIIGDIERFVAQSLYPYRIPIAILAVVAFVVFVVVARRRGWFAAMRRHPVATSVVAIGLIVILAPITWYLASPLFISTSVVEAAPPTVAPTASGPAASVPPAATEPTATEPESTEPPATASERIGTFVGADEFHFGSGTARLIASAAGTWTLRFEDFAVRNGPDLYVYLSASPDGYADAAVELGTLKADTGAFNYELPPGIDPAAFASVVIWCKQFAVQFAHAALSP